MKLCIGTVTLSNVFQDNKQTGKTKQNVGERYHLVTKDKELTYDFRNLNSLVICLVMFAFSCFCQSGISLKMMGTFV